MDTEIRELERKVKAEPDNVIARCKWRYALFRAGKLDWFEPGDYVRVRHNEFGLNSFGTVEAVHVRPGKIRVFLDGKVTDKVGVYEAKDEYVTLVRPFLPK